MRSFYILFLITMLYAESSYAQFQLNNSAVALGGSTYRLTQAVTNQAGSMWYQVEHDVRNPLSVGGRMYFGTDPIGADGIVFVIQNNCLNAGTAGGGIGYDLMPGQSIAVEFDTYENSATSGGAFNNSDPTFDHIAIEKQGNVNHANAANTLVAPVQMDPIKTNVKDGVWYDFLITYNPATFNLQVFFNGSLRASCTVDLLNTIFLADPYAYWGFTSSTGGFWNEHRVFIDKSLTTLTIPDQTICPPATVSNIVLPSLTRFNGKNTALAKPGTGSSFESGNPLNANEAFDGSMATRWASAWGIDPSWLYVDLGSPHDIEAVTLYWEGAYAATFEIQVSTDAVTWTSVFIESNPARYGMGPLTDVIVLTPGPALLNQRYVRMLGTSRATGYGYSLWEFQVYSKPKYIWSPNDGSINDIYSASPIFSPTATTTYNVIVPTTCNAPVSYNMTITVACPAPVELVSFDVKKVKTSAHVTWTTSMELDVNYFTVMRSIDGINFLPIGQVKAAGNSNDLKSYSFNDPNLPSSGTVYYQLKTTDIDGSSSQSPIKQLTSESDDIYIVNPVFDNTASLVVPAGTKAVTVTVVDVLGRVLFEEQYFDVTSPITFGQALPPTSAFYLAIIQTDAVYKTIKLVKRK